METWQIILIILTPIIILSWNVANEVSVLNFWNTRDPEYLKRWHFYDSVLRIILFPIIIFGIGTFNWTTVKILATCGGLYRPFFNTFFNLYSRKDVFNKVGFKEKVHILLYLSQHSSIDNIIIKLSAWISKKLKRNVSFEMLNLIIIILEIFLSILIWLL